jgi:hypothetical protein
VGRRDGYVDVLRGAFMDTRSFLSRYPGKRIVINMKILCEAEMDLFCDMVIETLIVLVFISISSRGIPPR